MIAIRGRWVMGGSNPEDRDVGRVLSTGEVAWSSGERTPCPPMSSVEVFTSREDAEERRDALNLADRRRELARDLCAEYEAEHGHAAGADLRIIVDVLLLERGPSGPRPTVAEIDEEIESARKEHVANLAQERAAYEARSWS